MLPEGVKERAAALVLVPFLAICSQVQAAEHEHPPPEKLGKVEFPCSCSNKVQNDFNRAVALLHSFAYFAAEKAFREVLKVDPNCALAHWGVAMTYFHQLWEPPIARENIARGETEIEQAKRLGASERERGFIDALGMVYANANSTPFQERLNAYVQAMHSLAESNRDDAECQIFYALALIATAPSSDTTHAKQKEATAILEPLFKKYPQHPGIAHYLIHACDNQEMAKQGLAEARVYSQIAPSAPHALHMPSHIYTRLGMWEDSITSNMAARNAARSERDTGEELHAMDYLTYAYLQLGRDADAKRVVEELGGMSNLQANEFKIGYAASAMPARYAIERRQWSDAAKLAPMSQAQPNVNAITIWARAVGLARGGRPADAGREIQELQSLFEKLRRSGDYYWATQVHVQMNEARAWADLADGKSDEAIKLMRAAADEEDAVEKRPVTPGAIVPAREQLGDLLLESGDTDGALKEFNAALAQAPKRRGSLMGKAQASAIAAH
jgi:tetratricopeptide (TPR) repeat protein